VAAHRRLFLRRSRKQKEPRALYSASPESSLSRMRVSSSRPPSARQGLSRLVGIIAHPINLVLPIDHQMIFKTSVGAAKGSGALREHVTRHLESWILVGTLILGVSVEGSQQLRPSRCRCALNSLLHAVCLRR
jgi:hypothetical protein